MQTEIHLTEDEKTYIVLKGDQLTDEEKARIMHRAYQRQWSRQNKEKTRQSQVKCLARKFDALVEREIGDAYE